jgi:hypothetical protein
MKKSIAGQALLHRARPDSEINPIKPRRTQSFYVNVIALLRELRDKHFKF